MHKVISLVYQLWLLLAYILLGKIMTGEEFTQDSGIKNNSWVYDKNISANSFIHNLGKDSPIWTVTSGAIYRQPSRDIVYTPDDTSGGDFKRTWDWVFTESWVTASNVNWEDWN